MFFFISSHAFDNLEKYPNEDRSNALQKLGGYVVYVQ